MLSPDLEEGLAADVGVPAAEEVAELEPLTALEAAVVRAD